MRSTGLGRLPAWHCRQGPIVTVEAFEELTEELDPQMYVVTAADGDERDGCLVGFASQCSIEPPLFVVWLSKANRTYRVASSASALAVHVPRATDLDVAQLFGTETGDEVDKLAQVTWRAGPQGLPVVEGCDWFAGRIVDRLETDGDHVGFVLSPTEGEHRNAGERLLGFQEVKDLDAGHDAEEGAS